MEQRVSLITLGVADLDRSRRFYERLGWQRAMPDTKDVVFFQLGGMALALYGRDDLACDALISAEGQGFGGLALAYNTRTRAEVDAVLAAAKAAGGTKSSNPARKPSGAAIPAISPILTVFSGRSRGILRSRSTPRAISTSPVDGKTYLSTNSHPQ